MVAQGGRRMFGLTGEHWFFATIGLRKGGVLRKARLVSQRRDVILACTGNEKIIPLGFCN